MTTIYLNRHKHVQRAAALACLALVFGCGVAAQSAGGFKDAPAPTPVAGAIPLDLKGGAQAYAEPEGWVTLGGKPVLRNVWQPTLTPVLPPPGKGTGAAVIVAPGGGFMILSMDSEGYDVANFLASRGIAAFVLKYRLLPTPKTSEFAKFFLERLGTLDRPWFTSAMNVAAEDAQEAIRVVRAKSGEWGVNPRRIGIIGFSAGAFTAMRLMQLNDPATNPDFIGYIYGAMKETTLPASLPPIFIALAADDPLFGKSDFGLIRQWQAAKAPVELHMYERGGHGWGYPGAKGTTTTHWPEQFFLWMESRRLLER